MGRLMRICLGVIFMMLVGKSPLSAQNTVGIGTATPNTNSVLDLVSPGGNQGVLLPRVSNAQRTAMTASLTNAENGLIVFDTDDNLFYHWVNSAWISGLGSFPNTAGGDLTGTFPDPVIRDDAVNSLKIQDGAVANADLADASVTVAKVDPQGNANSILGTDAAGNPQWEAKTNFIGTGLTDGTILVGDVANQAQPRVVSGDISMANDGSTTINDNTISSSQIVDNSISSTDIANGAVTSVEIADGAVQGIDIQDATITTADLADNSVTTTQIVDGTINAADIGTDAVGMDEISTGAVGSDEIADGSIQNADLSLNSVNSNTIVDGSVATDDIASGGNNKVLITTAAGTVFWENITLFETSTLAEGSIFVGDNSNTAAPLNARGAGRILIGDGTSVQSLNLSGDLSLSSSGDAQINNGVVGSAEVTDNSLTLDDIAPNAIEASELADNAVDNGALQDDAVSTSKIQDDAVNSAKISDGTIVTTDLADDAVTTAKMDGEGNNNAVLTTDGTGNPQWENRSNFGTSSLNNANVFIGDAANTAQPRPITGDVTLSNTGNVQINTDAVGSNEVINNSLTLDDIGPNAIEASELADNSVDAGAIQSSAVITAKISDDAVTVAKIDGAGNNDAMLTTDGAGNPQWESKSTLDTDPSNEIQDLNLAGNTLSLSGDATTVDLSSYLDNTDNQDLDDVLTQGNNAGGAAITNVADPTNAQDVATKNYVDTQSVDDADADPTNEIQDLNLAGNTLSLSGDASTVDLSGYLDNTDAQDLSLTGNTLSLTNDASTVDLSGYLDNTDSQDLSDVLTQGNDAGGTAITNVTDPTNAQDVATKNYVDNITVTSANIGNNSIGSNNIINGSITSADIGAGEVSTSDMADDAINSAKIADLTITNADISNTANITATKLQSTVMIEGEDVSLLNNDAGYLTSVASANITDGTIVDADVSASANIAATKLQSTVMVEGENVSLLNNDAGYLTTVVSADITDGTIANADISNSAAIDGTKVNPNFGAQNIQTAGTLNTGAATVSSLTVTDLAGATDTYTGDGAVNSFSISAAGVFSSSDRRLKTEIEDIDGALDRIVQVEGKQYVFKNDPQAQRFGVIAQDLQKLFPELVSENQQGYLAVNYTELIPFLIEAIKEQQKLIDQLSQNLNSEQTQTSDLSEQLKKQSQMMALQQQLILQMQLEGQNLKQEIEEIKRSLGLEAANKE